MKGFILLVFVGVLFTSCDPELNYYFSIENNSSEELTVRSLATFSDDTNAGVSIIASGTTVQITQYNFIGTTDNIELDRVYLDVLEIENELGKVYKKNPLDSSLWNKTATNRNDGEWLLKVGDEDF